MNQIARDYISANFHPDDRLAVVIIDKQSGEVKQRLATAERIALPDYQAWLRHENTLRREIYMSPNTIRSDAVGREKADVQHVRHLYADFDTDAATRVSAMQACKAMPQPNHLMETSPGKRQVIWRVEAFTKNQAEVMMREMVREFGADPACTDVSRVLRLPGFYNHKYAEPHPVTVRNMTDEVYRPDSFPHFAKEPQREYVGDRNGAKRMPGAALSQSERDWAFAMRHLQRGDDPAEVAVAIERFRTQRADKASPQAYAERTVKNALQHLTGCPRQVRSR